MWYGCKGVTLVELLVAVAIVGVLVSIAVPCFSDGLKNARQSTLINEFLSAFALARSEAIQRGHIVSLCRSADGKSCGGKGTWASGWLVFADTNRHGKIGRLDPGEPLLARYRGADPSLTFIGNHNVKQSMSFRSTGILRSDPGTLVLCDARGVAHAKAVVLAWTGRPRTAVDTDGDGIINMPSKGKNVVCGI